MKVCPQCKREYAPDVDFCPSDGTKLRARREPTEDPLLGAALDGRWVIEEKLGEGGMGAVYRGHQKSVDRTVAIKTLRPQLVDSEEFVDRFFREAKIAATISHPHSVTILDYGESTDGTLYLAMEFLEGELLTERIESGGITIKEVLEIASQVASALSAAHDNQIVHRDLKPDNIFLIDVPGGGTFIKVLDFGIAKMLDSKTQVTKTGMIFGTPEYMSPEQCRGDKIDGRADLYSLGCIMYELVGGRTPFRATTPMAVLMAHVNEAAPALSPEGTAAHVPYEVEQVIMRLLEKNPDNRFQSAEELRETLEAVLQALDNPNASSSLEIKPVPSREIVGDEVALGFGETVGMDSTGPAPPVATEPRRDQVLTDSIEPTNRSKAPLMLLAVLLVGVVAIAGYTMTLLSDDEPAAVPTQNSEAAAEPDDQAAVAEAAPTVEVEDDEPPETEAEVAAAVVAKSDEAEEAEAEPEPKPEPKPRPKKRRKKAERPERVVEKPAPTDEPAPKPKPKPKKKPKKKPRPVKEGVDTVNKKAEKARDDLQKGLEKTYDNVMDGLMQ